MAVDGSDNVYVADTGDNAIRKITPGGVVTTLAGSPGSSGSSDGAGGAALFNSPVGVAVDDSGNVYVADTVNDTIRMGISPTPVINSPTAASGYVGGTFTYLIQTTTPATSYTATNLPSWLSLNGSANLLSGIPNAAGTYVVTLTATNASGTSGSFVLTITIGSAPSSSPKITSYLSFSASPDDNSDYTVGYLITATNSPTSFSVSPTTPLPAGITLNTSSGLISGKTTVGGVFSILITATNSAGSDTETLNLNLNILTPQFVVLHNFGDGSVPNDGTSPNSLLGAADGSLYAFTGGGGNSGMGAVFDQVGTNARLFTSLAGTYGINPVGLAQGSDGNFYGVTAKGGSQNQGTIFKVTPAGVLTVIHTFGDGTVSGDGLDPAAGMILGSDGNFYGTTQAGGSANAGTLFVVTPAGVVTILHSFGDGSVANDGATPLASLCFVPNGAYYRASNGNYYADGSYVGVTYAGGSNGYGTVFAMTTQGIVTTLHSFGDPTVLHDGAYPMGGLADVNGNLYGTTYGGGTAAGLGGNGTFYFLKVNGTSYEVIHSFGDGSVPNDGTNPQGPVCVDGGGVVGTTKYGGAANGGAIFSEDTTGFVIRYSFGLGSGSVNGIYPTSGFYADYQGNLYGTTQFGGTASSGTLYALIQYFTLRGGGSRVLGVAPTFSLYSGSIPAGMSVNSATGALVGSPLPTDPLGVYTYSLFDGTEVDPPQTLVMGVYSGITTTSLPSGTVQTIYSNAQLTASNTPLSYTATGLPSGLTCSTAGIISGTPGTGGPYSVKVSATNSLGQGPYAALALTINLLPQTISNFPTISTQTYGETPFSITPPTGTSGSGQPVVVTVKSGPATISGNTITIIGVGTVVLAADQAGTTNYNAAPEVTTSFTVNPASQTISFPTIAAEPFGTAPFALSATASSGLPVSYTIVSGPATISGSTITLTGAGTVMVLATQAGGTNYLAATSVTQSFMVIQATQTIASFPTISTQTYGEAPFAITPPAGTSGSGQPVVVTVKSGPATISGNTITITGAGTVVLAADQAGTTNYSAAPEVTTSFTVNPAAQTINFATIATKTFGTAPFALSATTSSGLPVSYSIVSGPATISGSTITLTGAGTVMVQATQAGGTNYLAAASVTQSFTVTQATQTISAFATITSKTFGVTPFTITLPTASSSLPVAVTVKSGPATISGNTITITGAGTVVLAADQAGNTNYSAAPEVTTSFTVNPASQTISFPTIAAEPFGTAPFALSATASSGLSVSYTIVSGPATISGSTITLTGAGTVMVLASQPGSTNYLAATSVTQSFTVNAGTATITLGNLTAIYNGMVHAATATTVPANLNVTFTYNGNSAAPSGVGSYMVVATINDPNYQGNATGTLVISPGAGNPTDIPTMPPWALVALAMLLIAVSSKFVPKPFTKHFGDL